MRRRELLVGLGGVLGAASLLDVSALAKELEGVEAAKVDGRLFTVPGSIWMKRPENKEEIAIQFRRPDGYNDPEAVRALSWFFRDIKDSNLAVWVDTRLFELLSFMQYGISATHGKPIPIMLNSGYRTKGRNAKIEGAAKNSLHIVGRAGDIVFPGVNANLVGAVARHYNAGGVGFYETFSHVDIGPKRQWKG